MARMVELESHEERMRSGSRLRGRLRPQPGALSLEARRRRVRRHLVRSLGRVAGCARARAGRSSPLQVRTLIVGCHHDLG